MDEKLARNHYANSRFGIPKRHHGEVPSEKDIDKSVVSGLNVRLNTISFETFAASSFKGQAFGAGGLRNSPASTANIRQSRTVALEDGAWLVSAVQMDPYVSPQSNPSYWNLGWIEDRRQQVSRATLSNVTGRIRGRGAIPFLFDDLLKNAGAVYVSTKTASWRWAMPEQRASPHRSTWLTPEDAQVALKYAPAGKPSSLPFVGGVWGPEKMPQAFQGAATDAWSTSHYACCGLFLVVVYSFVILPGTAMADMVELPDSYLASVTGQALLDADKISASAVPGYSSLPLINGQNPDNGLTFYRLGLDGTLSFNMNINKMQLGCGGINNSLVPGCDIDLSNVSFMGSAAGGPNSDFSMTRPYLQLAIANDGTPQREVVGLGISSQSASGYLSIGQNYANGAVNLENGITCNTGASYNSGCNSGINMLSGFVTPRVFGYIYGNAPFATNYLGCLSRTSASGPKPGSYCAQAGYNGPANGTSASPIFGTRNVSARIGTYAKVTIGYIGYGATGTGKLGVILTQLLNTIHGITLANTPDFGLSMQATPVAYPKYDKTGFINSTYTDQNGKSQTVYDVANTGWWLHAPNNVNVMISDPKGPYASFSSLAGMNMVNQSIGQSPAKNCFGTPTFC